MHSELAAQFPKAEIVACNLSEMAQAIAPHRDALPVVTEEIGDTWIYGAASDPLKVARYREVARLREKWIAAGKLKPGDSTDMALLRRLLLEPEHTWGTDTKTWLDFDNYEPADLDRMLDTKNYKVVEFSWMRSGRICSMAWQRCRNLCARRRRLALAALSPRWPNVAPKAIAEAAGHSDRGFAFHGSTRSQDRRDRPPAEQSYRTRVGQRDQSHCPVRLPDAVERGLRDFIKSYLTTTEDWAFKDFGKPNIERFGARSQTWLPASAEVSVEHTRRGTASLWSFSSRMRKRLNRAGRRFRDAHLWR